MTADPDIDRKNGDEVVAAALAATGDVAYRWDASTDRFTWVAPADGKLAQVAAAVVDTEDLEALIPPVDGPRRRKALLESADGRPFDCAYRLAVPGGGILWVHERGTVDRDESGKPIEMRGVLRLADQLRRDSALLDRLANYDDDTDLFNRNRLTERLGETIDRCLRYAEPAAFLAVGIDRLALVTAALGYEAAEEAVTVIGQRLGVIVRRTDIVGRIGADSFGVIVARCPEAQIATVAEKIQAVVRDTPVETTRGRVPATVSIAAVPLPAQGRTAREALARAEATLTEGRRLGRERLAIHHLSEDERRSQAEAIAIGEMFQDAFREQRLCVHYQPIVRSDTLAIDSHECLIRMRTSEGHLVPAGAFVPSVERIGLAHMLDRRALELALAALERDESLRLAINVSAFTTSDPVWLRMLRADLYARSDLARRLLIEITETAVGYDIDDTIRFVAEVRELGCEVALDDFGSGFTSFRHLKALGVDVVKIDGSFSQTAAEDPDNRLFVRTLVRLASSLGIKTMAEGVETARDMNVLREEGVDYLQGYFFGRPESEPARIIADGALAAVGRT